MGICFLLVTVFLWTLSNFLASFIFSNQTYSKPFFLVYLNTSVFAISLIPKFVKYVARNGIRGLRGDVTLLWRQCRSGNTKSDEDLGEEQGLMVEERLLANDNRRDGLSTRTDGKLGFRETAVLSLEFCMLWFVANYLSSACLEYTSVASTTILTSTSGIWTLILGAIFGVERFSLRKLIGVTASLVGVILISTVDLSGESDDNRGSFPHKTPSQIALGDSMAFISALVYGMYVTIMKRRVGDEEKVDMKLFFGLVGVLNLVLLWPMFFILHWTNIEPFEMPPSGQIWTIVIVSKVCAHDHGTADRSKVNSLSSFISDLSWALAMLLTTPLVVTVGLSLTIPLSLVGEVVQYGQYSSFLYWVGAAVVVLSFLFINHESHEEGDKKHGDVEVGE